MIIFNGLAQGHSVVDPVRTNGLNNEALLEKGHVLKGYQSILPY